MITTTCKAEFRAAFRGILALTMLSALSLTSALAQSDPASPPSGWAVYGQAIQLQTTNKSTISTPTLGVSTNQSMTTNLYLTVYKNAEPIGDGYDYYLVTGSFRHAIVGYDSNWISVGYYAKSMQLTISGNGAELFDYGPNTTVGSNTTGFTVGNQVGTSSYSPVGNASFSYSSSFTSPDVSFETTGAGDTLNIVTQLPYPGYKGLSPFSPEAPSSSGYFYYAAAVFRVLSGTGLKLTVADSVTWEYDFVRGSGSGAADGPTPWGAWHDIISSVGDGVYNLDFTGRQISNSGMCLDVQGGVIAGGTPLIVWPCGPQVNQQWTYTAASQLQTAAPAADPDGHYCAELNSATSGGLMSLEPCDATMETQKFWLGTPTTFALPGLQSIFGLELQPGESNQGSQVESASRTGKMNQFWYVK